MAAFNPHVWGLFLQASLSSLKALSRVFLSIPMFGDSFCKPGQASRTVSASQLSIPMFGDSFCKFVFVKLEDVLLRPFNPHVWGLFLQVSNIRSACFTASSSFNPHVWGLFLQASIAHLVMSVASSFQSPCLGTLFARSSALSGTKKSVLKLSIPMFGDSFCKVIRQPVEHPAVVDFQSPCLGTLFASHKVFIFRVEISVSFNPHVWGLFLQVNLAAFELQVQVSVSFQSPCLGTLFARKKFAPKWARTIKLSIPMFGDSFCKPLSSPLDA